MVETSASRVIVALDKPNYEENLFLLRTLAPLGVKFKVGLRMLPLLGKQELEVMSDLGGGLFLDFKLHDISQTVVGAVQNILDFAPAFLTVHAEIPVMRAAVQAKGGHSVKLLGVTVLTSLDDADLEKAGYGLGVSDLVVRKARHAKEVGMDGLICSPQELSVLRPIVGDRMCLITPGVRPIGSAKEDQKRVMTPAEALRAGADYLVIGRPIIAADNPMRAAELIIQEVGQAIG